MRFVISSLLILLATTPAFADEIDCEKKTPDALPFPIALTHRLTKSEAGENCFQASVLREKYANSPRSEGAEEYGTALSIEKTYASIYGACEKDLWQACHPEKNVLSPAEADQFFEALKKESLFRAPDPKGNCWTRAYRTNHRLFEKGFTANTLIFEAPLIAGVSRYSGPSAGFTYGFHVVSEIRVKDQNGKSREMILDPQFMDRPMEREEYFRLTTGGKCEETEDPAAYCRFSRHPGNYTGPISTAGGLPANNLLSCGWSNIRSPDEVLSEIAKSEPIPENALLNSAQAQNFLARELEKAIGRKKEIVAQFSGAAVGEMRAGKKGRPVIVSAKDLARAEKTAREIKEMEKRLSGILPAK